MLHWIVENPGWFYLIGAALMVLLSSPVVAWLIRPTDREDIAAALGISIVCGVVWPIVPLVGSAVCIIVATKRSIERSEAAEAARVAAAAEPTPCAPSSTYRRSP